MASVGTRLGIVCYNCVVRSHNVGEHNYEAPEEASRKPIGGGLASTISGHNRQRGPFRDDRNEH
jgi:hypothetical protein